MTQEEREQLPSLVQGMMRQAERFSQEQQLAPLIHATGEGLNEVYAPGEEMSRDLWAVAIEKYSKDAIARGAVEICQLNEAWATTGTMESYLAYMAHDGPLSDLPEQHRREVVIIAYETIGTNLLLSGELDEDRRIVDWVVRDNPSGRMVGFFNQEKFQPHDLN